MYALDFDITIGSYKLRLLDSVTIKKSVENLADTAVITLPSTHNNKALEVEDKINIGDEVTIRLGYNAAFNDLPVEFEGYVQTITTDGGVIKIECEDELHTFRKELEDHVLENPTVEDILSHLIKEIDESGTLSLECDYEFLYDKFTIYNMTGLDVLKKIQEESKANIFFQDNTLHVHPHYAKQGPKVIYDFAVNIEKSELTYNDNSKKNYLVIVEGTDKEGKVLKVKKGKEKGDKITVKMEGVSDIASLETRAEEELMIKNYASYEGSVTGWLIPYVEPTCLAEIRDEEYSFRNGVYYVVSVETTFSSQGGKRKLTFGKKIE